MAFRGGRGGGRGGRGRGGWGGGGAHYVSPTPFILFPDTELPDIKAVKEEKQLVSMSLKWENFWKSSAYYLEETNNGGQTNSSEIERYSDKNKKKTASQRDSMYQILQLTPSNFPRVLLAGSQEVRSRKRVRWNPLKDMERLEALEKKAGDGTSGKKRGEGGDDSEKEDDEDDDDDKPKEGDEEFSDDGDYNQNIDFDDDEDDFNMDDGGEEEAEF